MNSTLSKALRICAAWAVLGAIIACGGDDEDAEQAAEDLASALAPAAEPTPAQPTAAPAGTSAVTLSSGFVPDPHTARGQAAGSVQASSLGPNAAACAGAIPTAPQHTLTLQDDFANLRILVNARAGSDTTLVIRKPDGSFACNDDGEALNPIVEGAFPAGTYQVYIGTYSEGESVPYVIGFSELASVTAADLGT